MSDTPMTDGAVLIWNLTEAEERGNLGHNGLTINRRVVLADFARSLERQLAEARLRIAELEAKP